MVAVVRDLCMRCCFSSIVCQGCRAALTLSAEVATRCGAPAGAVSVLMLSHPADAVRPRQLAGVVRRRSACWPSSWRRNHLRGRQDGLRTPGRPFPQTAREIGKALLDPFVLPFEVASVLLVVIAMVGPMLVRPDSEHPE